MSAVVKQREPGSLGEFLFEAFRPQPLTYSSHILQGARTGIRELGYEVKGDRFTVDGVCAIVRDPSNGQEYSLEIRPIYKDRPAKQEPDTKPAP